MYSNKVKSFNEYAEIKIRKHKMEDKFFPIAAHTYQLYHFTFMCVLCNFLSVHVPLVKYFVISMNYLMPVI